MKINIGKLLKGAVKVASDNPALVAKVVKAVPAIGVAVAIAGAVKAAKGKP